MPVIGTFLVEVEKVNADSKERITNEILDKQTEDLAP